MKKVYNILYNLVLAWTIFAFAFQMYFVYLHFTDKREIAKQIAARISKQPW